MLLSTPWIHVSKTIIFVFSYFFLLYLCLSYQARKLLVTMRSTNLPFLLPKLLSLGKNKQIKINQNIKQKQTTILLLTLP